MKTIVIAGGGSNVGKTTLAEALGRLLPATRIAKLGTHPPKAEKPSLFFPIDTGYQTVAREAGDCSFLIIESGAILDDAAFEPDLVIFLPAPAGRKNKPGSHRRLKRADLIRGTPISNHQLQHLCRRLDVDEATFSVVLRAIGVPVR